MLVITTDDDGEEENTSETEVKLGWKVERENCALFKYLLIDIPFLLFIVNITNIQH